MRKSLVITLLAMLALTGCAARRTTIFFHPEFDFALVERVAVVPFENLSTEQGAAGYSTRLFITELLAANAFDVVEPGETSRIITAIGARPGELDRKGLQRMADSLNVQAVIFGSVGESEQIAGRSTAAHSVSLNARMVDCSTGNIVWSAAVSTGGPSALARVIGVGESTRAEAIHKAVRKLVKSLVQ